MPALPETDRLMKPLFLACAVVLSASAFAQRTTPKLLARSANLLMVEGHVLDLDERPIKGAHVKVRKDHKDLAVWECDSRGRFDVTLEIGGLYSIYVWKEGFVKKLFIVDARSEDPTKVDPVPFEAFITLLPSKGLTKQGLDDLDFPFALIYYNHKKKQFEADPDFIEEMRKLEFGALDAIPDDIRK